MLISEARLLNYKCMWAYLDLCSQELHDLYVRIGQNVLVEMNEIELNFCEHIPGKFISIKRWRRRMGNIKVKGSIL